MTEREKFVRALSFDFPEKNILTENMGFWPETVPKWQKEGLGEDEEVYSHFGLTPMRYIPVNFNFLPGYDIEIIEETDEYKIYRDELKVTKKEFKNSSAMPHYIDFPIKGREDFNEIKERMNPLDPKRYPDNWDALVKEYKERDYPLGLVIRGPFAFCRDFMDFNDFMLMLYDDLELVKDMMEFQADFTIKLWEKALSDITPDIIWLGEDMAYKNGPMISPDLIKELIVPLYRKITDFLKSHNVENIFVDSDGNIEKILPLYIESGINGISPVEIAANMDPLKIRKMYPRLKMIGGVNKLNIAKGPEGTDEEISKVKKLLDKGGYIASFDHSVPPIVSYSDYSYYIEKLKTVL